jgi:hypothetical protein
MARWRRSRHSAPSTDALDAFADFSGIDRELVKAATQAPADTEGEPVASAATRDAVAVIPEREKTLLLLRLVEGDPHVGAELRGSVRVQCAAPEAAAPMAGELRARAAAIRAASERAAPERLEAERRRMEAAAEAERRARLDDLKRRDVRAGWRQIETEIERRNPLGYDRAAAPISDLEAIAAEDGTLSDFAQRLAIVRDRHARKGRFIERLGCSSPRRG